jgi:hypothetical protein
MQFNKGKLIFYYLNKSGIKKIQIPSKYLLAINGIPHQQSLAVISQSLPNFFNISQNTQHSILVKWIVHGHFLKIVSEECTCIPKVRALS